MESHIFIYNQIGSSAFEQGITLADVQKQYNRDATEVIVHINSPGGDVIEGFAIHDYLKNLPQRVVVIVEGMCYSIATVILLAGDIRMMNPNAEIMIHNPWGGIEGEADEIMQYAENVKRAEDKLANFYANALGHSVEGMRDLMSKTTFMNFEEALSLGFVGKMTQPFHAVAFYNPKQKQEMTHISTEDKNWLQKQFDKLSAMFDKHGIKAEGETAQAMVDITLVTGEGDEKTAYVDSDDGELEGKLIFMNEEMTEAAPDGIHLLRDGRQIDVQDGRIVTVRETEAMKKDDDEEMNALKAELAEANQKIESLTASLEESQQLTAKAQHVADQRAEDMKSILAEMQEIKARVIGGEAPPSKKPNTTESGNKKDPWAQLAQGINIKM